VQGTLARELVGQSKVLGSHDFHEHYQARAEGREPPLILWALLADLRGLSRVANRAERERSLDAVLRAENIWTSRQAPLRAALRRLSRADIDSLLVAAAAADRMAKGSLGGDAWVALEAIVARIAGLRLAA
jgi:DNA polymerase III delta subunit